MQFIDEGKSYRLIIDPMMKSQHNKILNYSIDNKKIIDIACGTGALSLKMASKASSIIGIDLSESMINQARRTKQRHAITNAKFFVQDATNLSRFQDNEFDIATISMAIHQFPREIAKQILLEMNRIASTLIILDYASKMPKNLYGYFVIFIEWLAGKEHHQNFRDYINHGGISTILDECLIKISTQISSGKNLFSIVTS